VGQRAGARLRLLQNCGRNTGSTLSSPRRKLRRRLRHHAQNRGEIFLGGVDVITSATMLGPEGIMELLANENAFCAPRIIRRHTRPGQRRFFKSTAARQSPSERARPHFMPPLGKTRFSSRFDEVKACANRRKITSWIFRRGDLGKNRVFARRCSTASVTGRGHAHARCRRRYRTDFPRRHGVIDRRRLYPARRESVLGAKSSRPQTFWSHRHAAAGLQWRKNNGCFTVQ